MIIGITGGIGSGKTTLCNKLRDAGYSVFNTDIEARDLQQNDVDVRKQIIHLLGVNAYDENGLNRAYVANLVFENALLLQKLNEIVHPAVHKRFAAWVEDHQTESLLFVESALLLSGNLKQLVDKVVLVKASEHTRLKRVCERDGLTVEQVKKRISNQLTDEDMIKQSDFVIDTDKKQIQDLSLSVFIDYIKHFRK